MPLVPLEEYKPKEKKEPALVPLEEYEQNLIPLDTYEANAKKTEAELKVDPAWINASKKYYEFNMGTDAPKLKSDEDYSNYGLRQMGWFNYNLPNMTVTANKLSNAEQQDQLNFVNLMDMYDNKKISAAGTGRFVKGVALDPSTYVGLGTFGFGLLGREGGKQGVKFGIRELVKNRAIQGAGVGAVEGAAYTTYDDSQRQRILTDADLQDGYDVSRGLKSAGLGAVLGGGLGGTIGGVSGYVVGKKGLPTAGAVKADPKTEPSVKPPLKSKAVIKKQIDDELTKKGFDISKPLYHGSEDVFDEFDLSKTGKRDKGFYGKGVYLTSIKKEAEMYGPNVDEYFVKGKMLDLEGGSELQRVFDYENYNQSTLEKDAYQTYKEWAGKLDKIDALPPAQKLAYKDFIKVEKYFKDNLKLTKTYKDELGNQRYDASIKMQDSSVIKQSDSYDDASELFERYLQDVDAATNESGTKYLFPHLKNVETRLSMVMRDLDDLEYNQDIENVPEYVSSKVKEAGFSGIRAGSETVVFDPKNIIKNSSKLTEEQIGQPRFAEQSQDQPPVSAYADELASSDGGNINNIKTEDVVEPKPDGKDFQTDTTTGLNQRVIDVGMEILEELEIPQNKNVRISDQLKEAVLLANSSPKFYKKFVDTLQKNNLTVEELSTVFRESISDSARRMQQLSVAKKSMKKMGQDLGEIAPDEGWYANFAKEYTDIVRGLDNIRRGLLVSQIATAMRNNTAQIGRVGMHTLTEIYDGILNAAFNPIKRAFGKETKPVDHTKSFRLMMNLTTNKKQAKDLTEFLTKYYVNESDRLFTKYASEVSDSSKAKVLKSAQKMVDGLNFLNRMQEFWYRRGMFSTSIQNTLANKGIDINKVGLNDDLLKYLSKEDITKAVDDSLYFTYAKTPDNKFLKAFVDISNSIPFVTTGVLPFARFMANAVEFQFKHSPVGFGLLLRPKEIKKIAAGDTTALSQAVVGSTLLLATIEAKRKGMSEDHKWYELETKSGKTIDMRPYFPLTPYLFVADVITRLEQGRNWGDAKDILQALTGAQFRAGASLSLVQNLIDGLSGLDTKEKVNKFMSDFVSDVLGGYLTPLRMFNDFIDQDQKFKRPEDTGEFITDTTNKLKTNIPVVREQFPEIESPTRAATPGRPDTVTLPFIGAEVPGPLTRQLTGATIREEKNAAEKEFDRLGFKMRDILPYSGNRKADQIKARYMGPMVEEIIGSIVTNPEYEELSNPRKEYVVRGALKGIRTTVNDYIKDQAIEPEVFLKVYFNRLPKYVKKILAEEDIDINNIKLNLEEE